MLSVWMLITVAQIQTAGYRVVILYASQTYLNPDRTPKTTSDLFY